MIPFANEVACTALAEMVVCDLGEEVALSGSGRQPHLRRSMLECCSWINERVPQALRCCGQFNAGAGPYPSICSSRDLLSTDFLSALDLSMLVEKIKF